MKKFMYINDVENGMILINTDMIAFVERESQSIWMQDGTTFEVKQSELDEILTDLERR